VTRITASKNSDLLRYEAEALVDQKAAEVRTRFATSDKHQIYADKRDEANRFLALVETGSEPDGESFPYLTAETGISAPTMIDLANLWLYMDNAWKSVASAIEQVSINGKMRIRDETGPLRISQIVSETTTVLDEIGNKPPVRPKTRL
jgi:hypothetical protein